MTETKRERVTAYIDGFNLYYGLRDKGWRKYYWLNVSLLVQSLLKPTQRVSRIKYFTARISSGDENTPSWLKEKMEAKRRRQVAFLEALGTLENVKIYEGHFLGKTFTCRQCSRVWHTHEEKMTDVCIATELVMDAFCDVFDTALIVSADSDLVPPIKAVRGKFKEKRIVVVFPPARTSDRLKREANAYFTIGEAKLKKSVFPDEVRKSDGYILQRPGKWK